MEMTARELVEAGLQLAPPWVIESVEFDPTKRLLSVGVGFPRGSLFPCADCGRQCKAYDTAEQEWRHLNFFEHLTVLRARVPRTDCQEHGPRRVKVPWADVRGFTVLFEGLVVDLSMIAPVRTVARELGLHDTQLWRLLQRRVEEGLARVDMKPVESLAVDETSQAKGHDYVTVISDAEEKRVLDVEPGKDSGTLTLFREQLEAHGGSADKIREVVQDMSEAFVKGVKENFPKAKITFDRFHVIKLANEAIDEVRRAEQKEVPELKNTRYAWLKNDADLTEGQRTSIEQGFRLSLKTARAYRHKLDLQNVYEQPSKGLGRKMLNSWIRSARHSGLEPIKKFAATIKEHAAGILAWFDSGLTNGRAEAINGLIQAAKAAARGYRNINYLRTVIYLRLGKLELPLPQAVLSGATHTR